MSKIDQNNGYVALAWDDVNSVPIEWYVDTSTGRVLMDIKVVTSHSGDTPSAKMDQNYENVPLFWDDTNNVVAPALCDVDGRLIVDVNVE